MFESLNDVTDAVMFPHFSSFNLLNFSEKNISPCILTYSLAQLIPVKTKINEKILDTICVQSNCQ